MTRPLLILRPQPGADATAARARALGLEPIVAPLFTIVPLAWDAPDPAAFDALLLTSANAARCAGSGLAAFTALPCWTVGESSAIAARAAGFVDVISGAGDGAALARAAAAAGVRRALHLHGRDHVPLSAPDLSVVGRAVYAAEAVSALPASITAARTPVALLHSPRAASLFASLVAERSDIALAAISQTTAEAAGNGWGQIGVASEPRDDALLEVAVKLCHKDGTRSPGTGGADGL